MILRYNLNILHISGGKIMEMLKKLFPFSFKAKNDIRDLLITVLVFIAADLICSVIDKVLGAIPLIGTLVGLVGWIIGLYFFVSIVLAVLDYLNVFKN